MGSVGPEGIYRVVPSVTFYLPVVISKSYLKQVQCTTPIPMEDIERPKA